MAIVIKNWSVRRKGDEFLAPELQSKYLSGELYGHPRFTDGTSVDTSSIRSVSDKEGCKIVRTKNSTYTIYEKDIDPEYESVFPNAYNRLKMVQV